jgi:phosphatidyl-myo-inositol alpha-mannosyltransferase
VAGGTYEVLFNGVDVERFAAAEPWPTEVPTVLFVGRHEARKGLGVLLHAFGRVRGPAALWVAGEGPDTERLRADSTDARVQWLGRLSDDALARRLAGAAVLCAPSLRGESFGVVLLEAMAARCAVVASDLDGYRAAAGGNATLVPPADRDALAAALGAALADAAAGTGRSSNAARESALSYARKWSMSELAARYEDVYARAVGAVGGAPGAVA